MSAHVPKTNDAGEAGIAFAQLRANRKIVLDEDGKRWAEDVERSLDAAENTIEALADALQLCVKWMPLAEVRSWPPGFRLRKEALEAARSALRAAGRLP